MENTKTNLGPLLIIIAACFWGSMGIFVRKLESYGFSAIQIASIRLTLGALIFCLGSLLLTALVLRLPCATSRFFLDLGLEVFCFSQSAIFLQLQVCRFLQPQFFCTPRQSGSCSCRQFSFMKN